LLLAEQVGHRFNLLSVAVSALLLDLGQKLGGHILVVFLFLRSALHVLLLVFDVEKVFNKLVTDMKLFCWVHVHLDVTI
jgi:hypothetical protein